MLNESVIKLDTIFREASQVIKNKTLPNHDAFTISEVIGAVLNLPKEYVIKQILDKDRS